MRVPVTADVQTRLKTRELVALQPGQILNLGVPAETDISVRVNDILKFEGRLAVAGGRAAVRVTQDAVAGGDEGLRA